MESSSSVTGKWNICTIGSVFCCLILILFLNRNDQILNLWAATTSTTSLNFESLARSETPTTSSCPPPIASVVGIPNDSVSTSSLHNSDLGTLSAPPLATAVPRDPVEPPQARLSQQPFKPTFSTPPQASMVPKSLEVRNLSTLGAPAQASVVPQSLEVRNLSTFSAPAQASVVPQSLSAPPIVSVVVNPFQPATNITPKNEYVNYVDKSTAIEPVKNKVVKKCNIYDGRWVYKPDGKPSYMASQCPFLEEKMSCQKNKRPDMEFEKWSWEANDCDLPLLNGTDMVERFKNKRVIFVGDSLNRNMWESLSCILYSNMHNASSKARINFEGAHKRTFLKAKDEYNFTVEFYWTPYLVELNKNHSSGKKVLVLDKLSQSSVSWLDADVMIFNSGMHWIQLPPKKGWELYEYNGKLVKDMPLHIAFKRGMRTWAKWVQKNVDPKKTSIFFRSISAEHLDKQRDQWCVGKTKPIMDESYVSFFPKKLIRSIGDVIKGMKKSQVKYMNITKMSEYRIDAHPSIFRYNDWQNRAKTDLNSLKNTADCGHWCLPGIPDTWNRMLYASLYFDI